MSKDKKLTPLRGFVLLKLIEEEQTSESGLVLPDTSKERQAKGEILEVGDMPIEYHELNDKRGRLTEPEVSKGNIVWFKRYAGEEVKEGTSKFMFVHYKDLLGVYV